MAFVYDDALRERIQSNLAAHDALEQSTEGRRHAAVAIVLVDSDAERHGRDEWADSHGPIDLSMLPGAEGLDLDGRIDNAAGGAAFLLCRRAARMNRHAGQFALPGGRLDLGESPLDAAIRETNEELGLVLTPGMCLGRLDDYTTRSGYVMSPLVFWFGGEGELAEDPAEVAVTYRISLRELSRADSPRFVTIAESDRPVVQLPLGNDLIHAPTAAPLVQFRWVGLEGKSNTRVDHFEQPVFAWK